MEKTLEFLKANKFIIAAGLFGIYTAAKSAYYLANDRGCQKCETTQAILGAGVTVWSGAVLLAGLKK